MSNLEKANKLERKWERKSISGGWGKPFKFNVHQKEELKSILNCQCADEVIRRTEKVIEFKLINDDIPKPNRPNETKNSLKLATDNLLKAMAYLNELDPLTADELPRYLYLAAKNADQQILYESPLRSLSQLIAGIEKFSDELPKYSTKDELSFLIIKVAKIFKDHNLKPAYSPESKFHRFLIVSFAAIGVIRKNISDVIRERLKQG